MGFFKRLSFLTLFKKDIVEKDFLDRSTKEILEKFDKEYRFKEVNELVYPDREIRTSILYGATELWKQVINASQGVYKKIQILEADYIDAKSKLDNKIVYELDNFDAKRKSIKEEIKEVDEEIDKYHIQRKQIEEAYHKVGEEKEVKGSLNRLSGFWFLFIMTIAGTAELFMYKNVFLSQEIGLMADKAAQDKSMVEFMALGMASGFTVMIIWLAHKLGELLRHYDSAIEKEKASYIGKFVFIAVVVALAIFATVQLRGNMHQILAKDQKVEQLQNTIEDANNPFADNEDDGGFGDDEEDNEFGDEPDTEDTEDELGADTKEDKPTATESAYKQIDTLRDEVNTDKGATAWLFSIINIFIVVGGVFLSYETHTSSKIYETIEDHINKLEKLKVKFEKELKRLDNSIIKFRSKEINTLFNDFLLKAALYDKEVRTYNIHLQIFALKMQLIEDHLKKIYEEKNITYIPITYAEVLNNKIDIDFREELQHVKDIEEYLVYKGENNV